MYPSRWACLQAYSQVGMLTPANRVAFQEQGGEQGGGRVRGCQKAVSSKDICSLLSN